jgi:hypothetical protein
MKEEEEEWIQDFVGKSGGKGPVGRHGHRL